jgi:hypothetical protein
MNYEVNITMANKEDVGLHNPTFRRKGTRAHFENPISSKVDTNPERYELVENYAKKPGINADLVFDDAADSSTALEAYTIANRDFEVLGTNAVTASVTVSSTDGALLMTTVGAAADQVIIGPHLDTGQTAWTNILWGTENQVIWEAVVRTGASVAGIILWAGLKLTDDQDIATDNDQAYFRFDVGETVWECVQSVGGVADVETSTAVTVVADTNYSFRIEIDSARRPHFFINDNEVHIGTALTNDVNLIPYVGVEGVAAAKTFNLIKQKISRIIFE